jgi:hypothetical protein
VPKARVRSKNKFYLISTYVVNKNIINVRIKIIRKHVSKIEFENLNNDIRVKKRKLIKKGKNHPFAKFEIVWIKLKGFESLIDINKGF